MKALAKPLPQRYQSAAAMKADIDRFLAGQPVQAPYPAAAGALPPDESPAGRTVVRDDAAYVEPRSRRRAPMVVLALLLLAILTAAAIIGPKLLNKQEATPQQAVPSLAGMNQIQAERALTEVNLELGNVSQDASASVPKGQVISSDPEAGTDVDEGTSVDIKVSSGKPAVPLPNVVGMDKATARETLEQLELKVEFMDVESDEPADQVIQQSPAAGQTVPDGTQVTLQVSKGPKQVPDVVGRTETRATKMITEAGFKVSVVQDPTTVATAGTVLKQSPQAGETVNQGTTITIVVSTYQPPVTPTPTPPIPSDTVTTPPPV
jgi:beta-lactam-binding protein with PASTA domain